MNEAINYQAQAYLGQHPKVSEGILKETACMHDKSRLNIADLEWSKKYLGKLDNPDLSFDELLNVAIELEKYEGAALWVRDPITDMAIKKGDTTVRASCKKKTSEEKSEEIVDIDA